MHPNENEALERREDIWVINHSLWSQVTEVSGFIGLMMIVFDFLGGGVQIKNCKSGLLS